MDMDFKDYFQIFIRRKMVILLSLAGVLGAVFIYTILQTPIYESAITLRIAVSSSGLSGSNNPSYTTQLLNTTKQIATSGWVLEILMDRLNLPEKPGVKSEVIPNTEIIKITVEHENPRTAADIAGVLADILITNENDVFTGGRKSSQDVLLEQLALAEIEIDQATKDYERVIQQTPDGKQADLLYQALASKQKYYESLQNQYKESVSQQEIRENMITVIEEPTIPTIPSKPKLVYNLVLGLALGLLSGVVLSFLIDSLDTTLYESEDIERNAGLQAFSKIPGVKKAQIKSGDDEYPPFSEAFRTLALKIQQVDHQKGLPVILMASPQSKQGASTIVSNLAIHLGEYGKKVVAADCNLRTPALHNMFCLSNDLGLTDVLEMKADLNSALQQSIYTNVFVLTSGTRVEKPTLLLGSDQMKNLIHNLRQRFDYILLDTPPLSGGGDVLAFYEDVDGILLVARRESIKRESLLAAKPFIQLASDKPIYLVVNQEFLDPDVFPPYYPFGKQKDISPTQ